MQRPKQKERKMEVEGEPSVSIFPAYDTLSARRKGRRGEEDSRRLHEWLIYTS